MKSLNRSGYRADGSHRTAVQEQIQDEIRQAAWMEGMMASITIEMFDVLLPKELKSPLLPLLEGYPYMQGTHNSPVIFPAPVSSNFEQLETLLKTPDGVIEPWTRACAIYSLGRPPEARFFGVIQAIRADRSRFVREAADWSLNQQEEDGELAIVSTLEKVIVLKTVSIFSTAPDDLLAEVAALVELLEVKADQRIFTKGEVGTRMYVIIEGQVQVHDGEQLLDLLGDREVFGEMALLDAESARHPSRQSQPLVFWFWNRNPSTSCWRTGLILPWELSGYLSSAFVQGRRIWSNCRNRTKTLQRKIISYKEASPTYLLNTVSQPRS